MSIDIEDKVTLAQKRAELVASLAAPLSVEDRVRIQGELGVINAKIKALNTTEAARLKAAADRRKAAGMSEAQANALRARAKAGGADSAEDDDPGQTAAINAWIVAVLRRGGVKVHRASDGNLDLIDAPARWVAITDALCAGIHAAARGEELPEVTAAPKEKPKGRRPRAGSDLPIYHNECVCSYKGREMPKAKKKLSTRGLPAKQALEVAGGIIDALLERGAAEPMCLAEIDDHPLLTADQQKLCKVFRRKALEAGDPFTMLDFALIALRATARDYAEAHRDDDALAADAAHRRAAILYAYEALKAGPPIITETIIDRGTLRDLELLVSHGAA